MVLTQIKTEIWNIVIRYLAGKHVSLRHQVAITQFGTLV